MAKARYTGRFAPSPTGPLHMGSLVTALASYLDARHHQGRWLLRIEDLDPPREQPEASRQIIHSLKLHGLQWDGDIIYQSQRSQAYELALTQLIRDQKAFPCSCSRSQLQASNGLHIQPCRPKPEDTVAWRLSVNHATIQFRDQLHGEQQEVLHHTAGDFVLKRKDKLYAYQLAVVVDDAYQGVSHIVRGSDLLDSTARQVFLQQQLGLNTPRYCHTPLLVHSNGQKMSKQNLSPAINNQQACDNLRHALTMLNQPQPPTQANSTSSLLDWAANHWNIQNLGQNPINVDLYSWYRQSLDGSIPCK